MAIKLKSTAGPSSPFTFDTPVDFGTESASLPSPPTSWLSARDMKIFGAQPLTSTSEIGVVKCRECGKPVLRSFMAEHSGVSYCDYSEFFSLVLRHMCRNSCRWEKGSEST